MKKLLRILIVEDSEDDALLIIHRIKKEGYDIHYKRVETADGMIRLLNEKDWDIILSDYSMPRFNGLKALGILEELGLDIPFIIISGTIGEEVAVQVMKAGAHDYIMKNNLKRLLPAIEREIRESKNRTKSKQLEEKLKEANVLKLSEEKFRHLVSSMPVGILLQNSDGKVLLINNRASELLRLTPEQIVDNAPVQLGLSAIKEDGTEFPGFMSLFQKVVKYQKPVKNIIVGVLHPKGDSRVWLFCDVVPRFNSNGELDQVLWTFIDRTERIQAKKALQESYEIINKSPAIVFLWKNSEGWPVEYVSKNVKELIGYTAEEFMSGKVTFASIIHPDDIERTNNETSNYNREKGRNEFTQEYRIITKEGKTLQIDDRTWIRRNENGEITHHQGIILDITKRKQAEKELHKLSQAVEQSPVSIIITNKTGAIEYVNSTFVNTTSYRREELIGKEPRILNSGLTPKKVFASLWETIESGNIWHGELCNKKKNGEIFWEWASISPLLNSKGQITHYIGVKEDITKRKKTENEIKEKNEELVRLNLEKDKFFSIIAHDLRGPFSSFLGLTDLLVREIHDISKEDLLKFVNTMKDSANRLYQLLENLLLWANARQGLFPFNPETTEVRKIVNDSISVLTHAANNKNLTIENKVPENMLAFVDKNMFQTIIRNFVSNAVKFTPKGGKITVDANKKDSEIIEFSITDTGIGMNEEILGNLFQLNAKINRPGTEGEVSTGLGLLLCKEFVKKHNGKIWAESQMGKGTTFYFIIKTSKY